MLKIHYKPKLFDVKTGVKRIVNTRVLKIE